MATVNLDPGTATNIQIRLLQEEDLAAADRICRLAFGAFFGVENPETYRLDRDSVRTRWQADPSAALAAETDGKLIGSNFVTHWGSVGLFGPLTVHPQGWDRGIGKRLLQPTMEIFQRWGTRQAGLFTFAHSPKHIHLYQKFDFWPRFLTAILSKAVTRTSAGPEYLRYSELPESQQQECLEACRELTNAVYEGLDLGREIRAVQQQRLGDTLLLWGETRLDAFAVCHCGKGTEAGSDTCYIKFGAARPGPNAGESFERLLEACEAMAVGLGLGRLEAGVNMARHEAYRSLMTQGFRTELQGVAMQRPNNSGYNRSGRYVIDDWR